MLARTVLAVLMVMFAVTPLHAQKYGGVLTLPHVDTPPSPSIQEEGTVSVVIPFMAIYNNLVIFDQHVARNAFDTIRPELASEWKWTDEGTTLTGRKRRKMSAAAKKKISEGMKRRYAELRKAAKRAG